MYRPFAYLPVALLLFLVIPLSGAWAHTGHTEEPAKPQEFSGGGSIYAADSGEEKSDDAAGGLFPSSAPDLFKSPMSRDTNEPMHEMESGQMDHDMPHMPDVKMSSHHWVSPSQKGYGVAAGITVLASLAFGVLSIFRPFE